MFEDPSTPVLVIDLFCVIQNININMVTPIYLVEQFYLNINT